MLLAVAHPGLRSGPVPCCPLATPCSPGQGSLQPHTLPRRHGLFPLLPAAFPAPPELCDATLRTTLQSPAGDHGGRAGALLHPRQLGSTRLTVTPSPFPREHPVGGAQGASGPQDSLWQRWCGQTLLLLGLRARTPRHVASCRKSARSISGGATTAPGISPGPGSTCPCHSYRCRCQGHRCRQALSAAAGHGCGTANTRWGNAGEIPGAGQEKRELVLEGTRKKVHRQK